MVPSLLQGAPRRWAPWPTHCLPLADVQGRGAKVVGHARSWRRRASRRQAATARVLLSCALKCAQVPPSDPLARFLAGGLAGAVSRTVTAPLERLRTMMMADAANARLAPTQRKMWASGGLLGLWRGNLASVVKIVPQSAIQFAVRRPRRRRVLAGSVRAACRVPPHASAAGSAAGPPYPAMIRL